jgi:hypothetical protein
MKKRVKKPLEKLMKKLMKKFVILVLLALSLGSWGERLCGAAQTPQNRKLYQKNLTYNKNALPAGWKYEAGYTLWRIERNLPANRHTYRKYKRDRAWQSQMRREHRAEDIVLDTLDWTTEEIALFWENYRELFQFQPSGVE